MGMNPNVAASYQRVVERWKKECPDMGEPLPFEVGAEYNANLHDCVLWDNSTVDSRYFYCDADFGRRGFKGWAWIAPLSWAVILFVAQPLMNTYSFWNVPIWLVSTLLLVIAYIAYRWWKKLPRWDNNVFSREDGKLYLCAGKDKRGIQLPHTALNFYEQHFVFRVSRIRYNTFYQLLLLAKNEQEGLYVPVLLLNSLSREETMDGWYFLVRFMDKDWPFNEKDYKDLQEIHDYHIKELGWKFGGILYADGTREMPG